MNILFIGPFSSKLLCHKLYHHNFIPYITQDYNTYFIDTLDVNNTVFDIDTIVKDKFNTNYQTIIFFTAGTWLGRNNNKIINHDKYYKIYDVWDQKIDYQANTILKPNRFNAFIYRYDSVEIDELKNIVPYIDNFKWYFYYNQEHFKNWNLTKKYDVLVYGGNDNINYPLRHRLLKILLFLEKQNRIKLRWIKSSENITEANLSKEINQSYLTVACKTLKHDRFLGKYQEIPLSYSCILGNIPTRYRNLLQDNMIEVDLNMNDSTITNIILSALKDKQTILDKTDRLYNKFKNMLYYHHGKKDFEEIITSIQKKIESDNTFNST